MNLKKLIFLCLLLLPVVSAKSQRVVDLTKIPKEAVIGQPIPINKLLNDLKWDSIVAFSKNRKKCRTNIDTLNNSFLAPNLRDYHVYSYSNYATYAFLTIQSYKGYVLSCSYQDTTDSDFYFFDKQIWMQMVNDRLPNLPNKFKLSITEPAKILYAYYDLFGINSYHSYGWRNGMLNSLTNGRDAVICLMNNNRIDLIRRLFDYSDIVTRVYAMDAMIYIDYTAKKALEDIKQKGQTVSKDSLDMYSKRLLTISEWKLINDLRDQALVVSNCEQIAVTLTTKIILSKEGIRYIINNYEKLKRDGDLH